MPDTELRASHSQLPKRDVVNDLVFQVEKLRLRKVVCRAQGHIACLWQTEKSIR